jgi:hypothetical protein
VYVRISENGGLSLDDYGTSYVTEAYVAAQIRTATGHEGFRRFERGLNGYQDVYVVSRDERRDFGGLRVRRYVQGWVDRASITPDGVLTAEGWAVPTDPDDTISAVEVARGGIQVLGRFPVGGERPDVPVSLGLQGAFAERGGWTIELHCGQVDASCPLTITAVSAAGERRTLWVGPTPDSTTST